MRFEVKKRNTPIATLIKNYANKVHLIFSMSEFNHIFRVQNYKKNRT